MNLVETLGTAALDKASGKAPASARILVVDDDERNLLALSEVLEGLAEVVTATSGRDALRQLLKGDFAVILLDVFMPGMDGYETASLIRERTQTARIPIIFLSAVNKETEHLMRGYAMGAVDYVFKPVDSLVLQSKVAVFVELYQMRVQIEEKSRAEQELREANYRAELGRLTIERELETSRQRQAAIIQSLPIVLYLESLDAEPRCPNFVSGSLEVMTGYSFDQVRSDPVLWQQRLHPEDRSRVLAALAERQSSGRFSIEYRWQCADGSYKHFHDQAVILKGGAGEAAEFAGTLTDVTEQRTLESQLLQAGKMDAIGQLTGGVAHDFNNLLAAVIGGIHLLERRVQFEPREQVVVDQMRHAAEQGAELVRRMMAFARKQDLTPANVEPTSLCETVAGLVEHTMGGTVLVDWLCTPTERDFYVDRAQLELALVNLILNARDSMPDGGKVEVGIDEVVGGDEATAELAPGDYLRVRIRDQGVGIAPELIDKITEPFFTTKEAGKGTGLGLSMVAGFVHQSGGKIVIDSAPGRGTTIDLYLPSTVRSALAKIAPAAIVTPAPGAVKSVLLVDDDNAVRTILSEQLRELGLTVHAVADGDSAIALLKDKGATFDLLLSDFAMPGRNGVDTIRLAKAERPGLRTLLMTGYADEETVAGIRNSIPVLRKPIDMNELVKALA